MKIKDFHQTVPERLRVMHVFLEISGVKYASPHWLQTYAGISLMMITSPPTLAMNSLFPSSKIPLQ